MRHHNRILISMALVAIAGFFGTSARSQTGGYTGLLEYSLPVLSSVPPIDTTQPSDVASAYLWLDELMRTSLAYQIDQYVWRTGYGDTLKFLAKMDYEVIDNNPLLYEQYDISHPRSWEMPYRWNYKADPDHERISLQNQICKVFNDTGRTGFLLACDIISDVSISDTIIKTDTTDKITPDFVLANGTILDEIKGQKIPLCLGEDMRTRKGSKISTQSFTVWSTTPVPADTGACLMFEYSPEWSRTKAGDIVPFPQPLSDSTGWWVKPGGEYIILGYLAGAGSDSSNVYFSVHPYWGVFGSQGAMYKVIGGIVQDPNDDFGLGASAGLPVSVWKSRLRARIYNILHP